MRMTFNPYNSIGIHSIHVSKKNVPYYLNHPIVKAVSPTVGCNTVHVYCHKSNQQNTHVKGINSILLYAIVNCKVPYSVLLIMKYDTICKFFDSYHTMYMYI